jgi:hypothetical protein
MFGDSLTFTCPWVSVAVLKKLVGKVPLLVLKRYCGAARNILYIVQFISFMCNIDNGSLSGDLTEKELKFVFEILW